MNRRQLVHSLGATGIIAAAQGLSHLAAQARKAIKYEVHGTGPALILGVTAARGAAGKSYINQFSKRYRIILMDYPPTGDDAAAVESSFTPDHVCDDILSVADAAGAQRFAWFGYSWGGAVGLQLAIRTKRLSALICGGWSPLESPYGEMARVSGVLAERAKEPKIWATFYKALATWPERDAVSKISVPRMTFAGSRDIIDTEGLTLRIGPMIAEHKADLESMGWTVRLVDNFAHELQTRPDVVVPLISEFLDPVLLRG